MEFRDLHKQYIALKDEIDAAIQDVLDQGQFIGGPIVTALEEELRQVTGSRHCITVANGTDALSLVLEAWGIGPGDAVFVPDFTFFATAEAVSSAGATPVFVDIEAQSFNMDPVHLEKQIQGVLRAGKLQVKALIPVDLFGLPADYARLCPLAERYGLKLLEDAAQGFGGRVGDKAACSFGDAAITSFFPAKPLGCYGDGGAIFTDDDELAALLASLKVHGKGSDKYDNVRIGVNSRLDTLQAAILRVKLKAFMAYEREAVQHHYQIYQSHLAALESQDLLITPKMPSGYVSAFAQYAILLPDPLTRDRLAQSLRRQQIPTMVYYHRAMHQQTVYAAERLQDQDFPVSSDCAQRILQLPIHPYQSEEDIRQVTAAIAVELQGSET